MRPPLNLETPLIELYKYRIARLGQASSQNLAASLARFGNRKTANAATVEDLLWYLPMRYEDRSNLTTIRDLKDGIEASLELFPKVAGGYQVGKNRAQGKPKLYIFQVTATDKLQSGRPVVVWWFVSGPHARDIIDYYMKRLTRGARFITFGKWEWDERRGTFALRLQKPADELEMLPVLQNDDVVETASENKVDTEEVDDPRFAAIHVGRRVPVYRKLGDLSSKRLREIIHALLDSIPSKRVGKFIVSEEVNMHVRQTRNQKLSCAINSLSVFRNSDSLAIANFDDRAVADNHGLMLDHTLFVHGNDVDVNESHDAGRCSTCSRESRYC